MWPAASMRYANILLKLAEHNNCCPTHTQIVALMSNDCATLCPHYQTLLRDSSFEVSYHLYPPSAVLINAHYCHQVLSGLAPHLPQVMESLAVASNLAQDTRVSKDLPSIPHSPLSSNPTSSSSSSPLKSPLSSSHQVPTVLLLLTLSSSPHSPPPHHSTPVS